MKNIIVVLIFCLMAMPAYAEGEAYLQQLKEQYEYEKEYYGYPTQQATQDYLNALDFYTKRASQPAPIQYTQPQPTAKQPSFLGQLGKSLVQRAVSNMVDNAFGFNPNAGYKAIADSQRSYVPYIQPAAQNYYTVSPIGQFSGPTRTWVPR